MGNRKWGWCTLVAVAGFALPAWGEHSITAAPSGHAVSEASAPGPDALDGKWDIRTTSGSMDSGAGPHEVFTRYRLILDHGKAVLLKTGYKDKALIQPTEYEERLSGDYHIVPGPNGKEKIAFEWKVNSFISPGASPGGLLDVEHYDILPDADQQRIHMNEFFDSSFNEIQDFAGFSVEPGNLTLVANEQDGSQENLKLARGK